MKLVAAVSLTAALALSGCTEPEAVPAAAPSAEAPSRPSSPAPTPAPSTPGGEAAPRQAPPSEAEAVACDPQALAAIDARIDAQLADFRAGDFRGALRHATRGFRSSFTPERFEETITSGFPAVRLATGHRSAQCVRSGPRASVLVELEGDRSGNRLVYEMALEDGDWRIGGAIPHGPAPAPSHSEDTTTVQAQRRRLAT